MEFKEYRFDEVTINFDKKRIPLSSAQREKMQGKYRYYGAQGVIDHIDDFIFDGTYLLIAEDGENLKSKKQDIAQVVDGQFWVNNHAHVIQGNELCDTRYLCYLLNNMDLSGYVTGSAQPKLSQANLNAITLVLPSIAIQKKIVECIYIFDKKIGVNNAINDNLQQQAQAVFKAWFVDFEPFGGALPNDWKHAKLGTSCNCVLGGTPSRNKIEYWNGTIPWINSGEVNKFRIIKPSETITNLGLEKSATKLLPAKTTVLAITGATLGQVSLLEIDACANQSVVGIIPNDNLPYEYIYPLIKQNIAELVSHQTGGAQQHINKQNVENLDIVIPPYTYLAKYQNTVCSIYEMIANNCFENERLSSLRDNLLPKLMSGEIDVSDIQL